eukprot:TRINITY_DN2525_c0_g1_i3.p1 TRINITY_DN2525_c0_g1~~TRINITY_DN2525_c0_g1_i3.p1  ORF type:complete len:851 (+),score=224.56 TRINITY_DN2525_c0_g1_i3:186-2738(+)
MMQYVMNSNNEWDSMNSAVFAQTVKDLREERAMVTLLLRTVEEMCRDPICITDIDGNIRYKNPACQDLFTSCGINMNGFDNNNNNNHKKYSSSESEGENINFGGNRTHSNSQPNLYNLLSSSQSNELAAFKSMESYVAKVYLGGDELDPLTGRMNPAHFLRIEAKRHNGKDPSLSDSFIIHRISLSEEEREKSLRCYREIIDYSPNGFMLWQCEPHIELVREGEEQSVFTLVYSNEIASKITKKFSSIRVGKHLHQMFDDSHLHDLNVFFKRALKEKQTKENFKLDGINLNFDLSPLRHGVLLMKISGEEVGRNGKSKVESNRLSSVPVPSTPSSSLMAKAGELLSDALGILKKQVDSEGNTDFSFVESNIKAKSFRKDPSLFSADAKSPFLTDMVPAFLKQRELLKSVGESEVGVHFPMIIADHINQHYGRAVWKVCMTRIEGDFFSFHCNQISRKSVKDEQLGWNPRGTFPYNCKQPVDGVWFLANYLEGIKDLYLDEPPNDILNPISQETSSPLFPISTPPFMYPDLNDRGMKMNSSPNANPFSLLYFNPLKNQEKVGGISYHASRMGDPQLIMENNTENYRIISKNGEFSMPVDLWFQMYDDAPIGMVIANDNRYLRVNKKFSEIVGYNQEELSTDGHFIPLSHPEDADKSKTLFNLKSSQSWVKRYIRKDGSMVYCILFCKAMSDPLTGQVYGIGNIIPLEEMKQTFQCEDPKLQDEVWFQCLDKSRLRACLVSPEGTVVDANDAFLQGLEIERQDIVDKDFVRLLCLEDRLKMTQMIFDMSNLKLMNRSDMMVKMEVEERIYWTSLSIAPLIGDNGLSHVLLEYTILRTDGMPMAILNERSSHC